jgi:hypothetical protein
MTEYGEWVNHLARKWESPPGVDRVKIIGFAAVLASWGADHDGRICPSAATIAKELRISERTAKRLRTQCIRLGLFRETGEWWNGVPVLECVTPQPVQPCGEAHDPRKICVRCAVYSVDVRYPD